MSEAVPTLSGAPQPVEVMFLQARRSCLLVAARYGAGRTLGYFYIDYSHPGYSATLPLLLSCLNSGVVGKVSLGTQDNEAVKTLTNSAVDWFQWPNAARD